MGTLALLLMTAAMGSSPGVVVLPVRTAAVAPERATAVAERVAQVLQAEGVSLAATPSQAAGKLRALGAGDPTECRGEASCAARLGAKLEVGLVVAVGVGEFEGNVAVHLEVVEIPFAERSLLEDQVLPSDLQDPLWARALSPFARKLRERAAAAARTAARAPPPRPPAPTAPAGVATVQGSRDWVISLQADSELDARGGMVTVRAGRQLLPALSVSAGALVTAAGIAGAAVQARAVPFAGDLVAHPVVALEVPVLFRSSPAVGVRPSVGVEVTPLPWLSLAATASYLRFVGVAADVKPGYWLGGAEVALRL